MAEKTPVTMSGPTSKSPQNRKLGMDKPCSHCGSPIYFNYSGPLDGICGKCTDVLRRRLAPRQGLLQGVQQFQLHPVLRRHVCVVRHVLTPSARGP